MPRHATGEGLPPDGAPPPPRTSRRGFRALVGSLATALVAVAGVAFVAGAPSRAADKSVYVPASWAAGDLPWSKDRTRESANFALFWGEKSGTDPLNAPADYRFDPANVLAQLETMYSFYRDDLKFTPETGAMAQYKVDVVVTGTWNDTSVNDWATATSVDGKVGLINVAPAAVKPGSWGLAHEMGHIFQFFTSLGRPGTAGFANGSSHFFFETSAEYMAMQVYPDGGAGDLTRFLRTENLPWSSTRHMYGAWMLMQFLVDANGGSMSTFNDLWNKGESKETPLEVYRRLKGLTQDQLNLQLGQYAQHQVTYDYANRAHLQPFVDKLWGHEFINAYNGVPVDAVDQAAGHYAVPDHLAPSDAGYNKIKLVPQTDGGMVRLHFKGHVAAAAQSGWAYGFVAVKNGVPRYGPVSTAPDGELSFQTQPGEKELYLTVAGAPGVVHPYGDGDTFTRVYRYPYEFVVSGATPSGYEPGYVKPAAAAGGHWHTNGGGWVSNEAKVAATAYVGPRAAVYGDATVSDNARIEGLAWVNSGGKVSGNAVVRDNALVQGGVSVGGTAVLGGDAEPGGTCTSGTYLRFDDSRRCDGGPGETDVNPTYARFATSQLSITAAAATPAGATAPTSAPVVTTTAVPVVPTTSAPVVTTTSAPVVTTTSAPVVTTTSGPVVTTTAVPTPTATTTAAASSTVTPAAGCTAAYSVGRTRNGRTAITVRVTAGATAISGWKVTWTLPSGGKADRFRGATGTVSGGTVTAAGTTQTSTIAARAERSFTLSTRGTGARSVPAVSCSAL